MEVITDVQARGGLATLTTAFASRRIEYTGALPAAAVGAESMGLFFVHVRTVIYLSCLFGLLFFYSPLMVFLVVAF